MKFGLFGINFGPCANPATAAAVAQAAEAAGFESLWTGEHIVLPEPQAPPSPVPADTPFIDSAVALGFIAAHTRTVRLGTGIIILPQRNPVVLAKELASVDVLSNGRLIFGIGIGYLKPEFEAIGAPFDHKGPRSEEFLAAMIALWSMDKPEYRGRFVAFGGVNAMPRPVQKPHPEIVFGGHTKEAYGRAARLAKGWFGFALDVEATTKCVEGLRAACHEAGRRTAWQSRSGHGPTLRRRWRPSADSAARSQRRAGSASVYRRDHPGSDWQALKQGPRLH
jgi:probable F420-dependent oxidoreductase